jgi:hypothetical protein
MTCGDNGGKKWNGDPCKRHPAHGMRHCAFHGGEGLSGKIKAELAMAVLRLPAIEVFVKVIEQFHLRPDCPACGGTLADLEAQKVAMKAAVAVLDRTGLGPRAVLELVPQNDGGLDFNQLLPEERGELLAAIATVKDIKQRLRNRILGMPDASQIIDASVVKSETVQ